MKSLLAGLALALLAVAAPAQTAAATGEVMKIDKPAARVTIKHDGVKNLDMPPMTMAFHLADPKLADGVAVGDKVSFTADRIAGQYTVTQLTTLAKAP